MKFENARNTVSAFARLFSIGLGTILVSATAQAAAPYIRLERETPALRKFADQLESALPASVKASLRNGVRIRFISLGTAGFGVPSCPGQPESPNYKYGYSISRQKVGRTFELDLHEGFIPEIERGEARATRYPCKHRNLYRLAMASALHEIAHGYDDLDLDYTAEDAFNRSLCLGANDGPDMDRCKRVRTNGTTVSGRLPFKAVMGTADAPQHINFRSPEPYEFTNDAEMFAVNFEYFLLDPEYGCRRPTAYAFFSRHFNHAPRMNCTPGVTVPFVNSEPGMPTLIRLDPKRIYEIHYLLADTGEGMMSQFGHSMFRIIGCAPERKAAGPDCLKDIDYHVVASYRADINGTRISPTAGLNGKYPSQLFLIPMGSVQQEYTMGEERDLISYPLKFNPDQLERCVRKITEHAWEHSSKYYYLKNNCATESWNLLRACLFDDQRLLTEVVVNTPKDLRSILDRLGYIDHAVMRTEPYSGRYFFPSIFRSGAESFNELVRMGLRISSDSQSPIQDYFNMKSAERFSLIDDLIRNRPRQADSIYGHAMALEQSAKRRVMHRLKSSISEIAERIGAEEVIDTKKLLNPWSLAPYGYGIPSDSELPLEADVKNRKKANQDALNRLTDQVKPQVTSEIKEAAGTLNNITKWSSSLEELLTRAGATAQQPRNR